MVVSPLIQEASSVHFNWRSFSARDTRFFYPEIVLWIKHLLIHLKDHFARVSHFCVKMGKYHLPCEKLRSEPRHLGTEKGENQKKFGCTDSCTHVTVELVSYLCRFWNNISYASVVFVIRSFLWQLWYSQVEKLQLQRPDTKTTSVNLQEETFLRYFRQDQSGGEQN